MQRNYELLKSICIVRLSAIGDVCHAVATVQAIQRHYPDADITWVIGRIEHSLVSDISGVKFVVFDKKRGFNSYLDLHKKMVGTPPYDVLLQMQTSLRSNLVGGIVKAKRKIGFPASKARELHRFFVGEHLPETEAFHVLDVFKHFASGINVPNFEARWDIPIPPSAIANISNWLNGKSGHVVISPSASNIERNWLPSRYAAIARHCFERGLVVVLTGSKAEQEIALAKDIEELAGVPIVNLAGKTNLKELLGLCRFARLVIGPDSGTVHMATTQLTPVIGLYAHSNPKRTGPYGDHATIADAYTPELVARKKTESMYLWGHRLKGASLMSQISTDQVISLIDQTLSRGWNTRDLPAQY